MTLSTSRSKYSIYAKCNYLEGQKLRLVFALWQPLSRYTVKGAVETWKIWSAPNLPQNDHEHLTGNSTLHTRITLITSEGRILVRFTPRAAIVQIQCSWKSESQECPKWPQTDLETLAVESNPIALSTYPKSHILVWFDLLPAMFVIQSRKQKH